MNNVNHLSDLKHLLRTASLGIVNELDRTFHDDTEEALEKAFKHLRASRFYLKAAQDQVARRWE